MPYKLDGNCVKKLDGTTVKCHPDHASALAHLRALEANVTEAGKDMQPKTAEKMLSVPTQAEAGYIPLSATKGEACANCRWFLNDGCYIIANQPEPIIATGYCDRWEAKPEPAPDATEALAEVIVEAVEELAETVESGMGDMGGMLAETMSAQSAYPKEKKPSLLQRAKHALFGDGSSDDAFSVHKGANGKWYWVARHTNAYEDRDHEILSEKAHEAYITRLDMGLVPMPELWAWHMKGTRHGQADTVFGVGRMVVSVGHFDDTAEAQAAIGYYRKHAKDIKLSHGFTAPVWAFKDGVYESYNTFEISTLPDKAESNPYTSFEQVKAMQPNPKKIEFLSGLFGKERADAILADTERIDKAVNDLNVKYKDYSDVVPADAKPDDKAKAKEANEPEHADFAGLFGDLMEAQKAQFGLLEQLVKRQDQMQKQLDAAVNSEKELRQLVNAGPRRPADDLSTEITKDDESKLKEQFQGYDMEASKRWGVPVLENPR